MKGNGIVLKLSNSIFNPAKKILTMALRLIEIILAEKDSHEIEEALKEQPTVEIRKAQLGGGEVLMRILVEAEKSQTVLDLLDKKYTHTETSRIVVLPVEAILPPPAPLEEAAPKEPPEQQEDTQSSPERISREELYEDITDAARCSRVYMAMVVLSSIVAAVGLHHDSLAIIIGAMVIAPLLGPNVALALATTLGDMVLARRAVLTGFVGIMTAVILATAIGIVVTVDPTLTEISTRTRVRAGDVVLALAAGSAGALAFTTGVSVTLIGVMVAVALLPPLITFGLVLGGGYLGPAWGALLLFLLNLICVNLAGVITFLIQGIRPATWWEADRAKQACRMAICLWALLLAAMMAVIIFSGKV